MSEAIIDIKTRAQTTETTETQPDIYMLRVLNGAQAGAEIALEAKRYRLGADEDCDIVLTGDGVDAHHLDLFFADGLMTLTHRHAPIFLDDQPIATTPIEIEAGQIMRIGAVAFCFGNAADDWPQAEEISEVLAQIQALPPEASTLQTLMAKWNMDKPHLKLPFIFGGVLAGATLVILVTIGLHHSGTPKTIMHSAADRLVEQMSSDPAYANIKLLHTSPKKQLVGYIARTADLNRLRSLARNAHTDLNIISIERLDKSLNIVSQAYGSHLTYRLTPGDGRDIHLLLYGTTHSIEQRETISALLRRDLPAITSIKIDIISETDAIDILNGWLERYPVFSGLSAQVTKKGIAISGNLLGNFRDDWQKAFAKSPPQLPQNMRPLVDINFAPIFPGRIVSFVTGQQAKVRIFYENTSTLASIGDKIKGGFMVKQINRNKIILGWRRREFIYPLPE